MTQTLASFLAVAWYIVYVLCFMVLPELIVYCVWRFLRDVRRIAKALELLAPMHPSGTELAPLLPKPQDRPREARIALSAFGR